MKLKKKKTLGFLTNWNFFSFLIITLRYFPLLPKIIAHCSQPEVKLFFISDAPFKSSAPTYLRKKKRSKIMRQRGTNGKRRPITRNLDYFTLNAVLLQNVHSERWRGVIQKISQG